MDAATEISSQIVGVDHLDINFSWKKFESIITSKDDPNPIYTVNYRTFQPNLIFKKAIDGSTFGTGTVHAISIHGDCEVRGRSTKITAMKRFKTAYTHISYTFSGSENPATMTWTSSCGLKNWDFVCLDANQNPVGRLSANTMSLKNVGKIEFLGPVATTNEAFKEEMVIVGMTLLYCMTMRSTSILSLFGAIFARTGKEEVKTTSE